MQFRRNLWTAFKNFAILFSFVMNFIVVVVLAVVVYNIFIIKNGIAEPLIDGLHRNFVGLDEAEIITTIPVQDEIGINFVLPINQETVVVLTQPVPLSASTTFDLGEFGSINGQVFLNLPVGLQLPVQLSMDVPVEAQIPISLNVAVNIPLQETQLHQPFVNLRDLFEPFVRALDNLPSEWAAVPGFGIDAIEGEVNLLNETEGSRNPWPGPGADTEVVGPQLPPETPEQEAVTEENLPPTPEGQAETEDATGGALIETPTLPPLVTATPLPPDFTPAPTATTVPLQVTTPTPEG